MLFRSRAAPAGEPVTIPDVAPTSVFVPSRLELALPSGAARFIHNAEPAAANGYVEQWHTRLARRTDIETSPPIETAHYIQVRAALPLFVPPDQSDPASADYVRIVDEAKINSTLDTTTANQLVFNSAVYGLELKSLALSPAGATLDMDQSWDEFEGTWPENDGSGPGDPTLKAYRHRVMWGRDAEIRKVERGRILPFLHPAILTTTTKRVPRDDADGSIAALKTVSVLTIYQPVMSYAGDAPERRAWPWERVKILNPVSSDGNFVSAFDGTGYLDLGGAVHQPRPHHVNCRATDRAGNDVEFSIPAFFAASSVSDSVAVPTWNAAGRLFHIADLGGRPVVVAPPGSASAQLGGADTMTLLTREIEIGFEFVDGASALAPTVHRFLGSSPVINAIAGPAEAVFHYARHYRDHGFDSGQNPGEVVLDVVDALAPDLAANAKAVVSAGLAPIRGLSRRIGTIAAGADTQVAIDAQVAKVAADRFDPADWLGDLPANLFGIFPLRDLLALRPGLTLADAPRQIAEIVDGKKTFSSTWDVDLLGPGQTYTPAASPLVTLGGENGLPVRMHLATEASFDESTQTVRAATRCDITDAVLRFVPTGNEHLVSLPIKRITFESSDSAAPDIDLDLGAVTFGGPLSFVKTLADLIAATAFAKPPRAPAEVALTASTALASTAPQGPSVQVLGDRVLASMGIAVPNVAVGMFSLRDLAFGSTFEVFFNGDPPLLSLNFATIDNPFRLTVSALGGGGHLLVQVSAKELVLVAGKLEFGASVSVDLAGIAKGSASVMGGIYFELAGGVSLTGYLDIRGSLEILSIIAVAVAVTLLIAYELDSGKVEGTAELAIKIKVLFFKKTVRFEVHRQFAGANADPTFREVMAPADWPRGEPLPWDAYCTAFAAA